MNRPRRMSIDEIINTIGSIPDAVDSIRSQCSEVASDERDYYDAIPENLQDSDRGIAAEAAADVLDEAEAAADEAMSQLESIIDFLNEAKGD